MELSDYTIIAHLVNENTIASEFFTKYKREINDYGIYKNYFYKIQNGKCTNVIIFDKYATPFVKLLAKSFGLTCNKVEGSHEFSINGKITE